MTEKLNQDFLDFIGLLDRRRVEYLVVGGYAVGLHGFPRYTGDIDFLVAVSERNASALMAVFEDFGFGDIGLTNEDFLVPDFVVEIGREPRKIQVLTGIDGVEFDRCYRNRVTVDHGNVSIDFIGLPELLENKKASGRPKDLLDVAELTRAGGRGE